MNFQREKSTYSNPSYGDQLLRWIKHLQTESSLCKFYLNNLPIVITSSANSVHRNHDEKKKVIYSQRKIKSPLSLWQTARNKPTRCSSDTWCSSGATLCSLLRQQETVMVARDRDRKPMCAVVKVVITSYLCTFICNHWVCSLSVAGFSPCLQLW